MKNRIWKFSFLILILVFVFVGCKPTKIDREIVPGFTVDDAINKRIRFFRDNQAISAYEWIKTVPEIILKHSYREKLIYVRDSLSDAEFNSLSNARRAVLTNAESFESLHTMRLKPQMYFMADDGKELSAIEFFLIDYAEGGTAVENMSNEQRVKLYNLFSDFDIKRLSSEQLDIFRGISNK